MNRRKMVWTPAGYPAWEVYDLATDPDETTDVFGRDPQRDALMSSLLRRLHSETKRE